MTSEQKMAIMDAWDMCDNLDKSTEYMLQYMSDVSGLDYDEVVEYLATEQSDIDRQAYYDAMSDEL